MVGDGDAVRIASQIMQHMFGAAERRLGIDNPVLAVKHAQEDGEALLVVKWHALTEEAQLIAGKEAPQAGNELAAEDTAEHLDRQQESGTRCDPARVVCRESAAGHHAVDVRMWSQRLSPSVQDGQEASLCAQVLGIGKDLEQCGGTGLKEQRKQLSLVLPHQRHKLVWNAEDEMEVADRQQLLLALLNPLVARSGLTLGAVPVAAGVIRDGLVAAVYAGVAMTAEGSGAAARDGIEHLRCGQVKEALYRSRKLSPAIRMTSATSKGGRLISSCPYLPRGARSVPAG